VKYTQKVTLSWAAKSTATTAYIFWIQDSGAGISTEKYKEYFHPISVKYRKKQPEQSGFRYSCCKRVNRNAWRKVWVDSVEGSGTTVNVTIPITPVGARA
jgi:light-regulated signal transduction histidine kinase (bacteriophytochrome)